MFKVVARYQKQGDKWEKKGTVRMWQQQRITLILRWF